MLCFSIAFLAKNVSSAETVLLDAFVFFITRHRWPATVCARVCVCVCPRLTHAEDVLMGLPSFVRSLCCVRTFWFVR